MRLELYPCAFLFALTLTNACVTADLLTETADESTQNERTSEADAEPSAPESNEHDAGGTDAISSGPVALEGTASDPDADASTADASIADSTGADEVEDEEEPEPDVADDDVEDDDVAVASPDTQDDVADEAESQAATNCVPLPQSGRILVGGQLQLTSDHWHRPNGYGCDLPTSVGSSFPYDLHTFCNTAGEGEFSISVAGQTYGDWSALADPVVFIYAGGELPDDTTTCLDFDDDSYGGGGALVQNLPVGAGELITVVVTSFYEDDSGYYEVEIEQN